MKNLFTHSQREVLLSVSQRIKSLRYPHLQTEVEQNRQELSTFQAQFASLAAKEDSMKSEVGRLKGELNINQGEQKDLQTKLNLLISASASL